MRREELEARLQEKAGAIAQVLNSPAGEILMLALEDLYYHGKLEGADQLQTYKNLGAREVIRYLRAMKTYNERTGAAHGSGLA